MTGQEAVEKLEKHEFTTGSESLDRMNHLLELLNHPEKDLKFVHLGGTNGKGSVSAMLYAIFNRCEYKAGLFTSPYLFSIQEQIQVDGENISEDKLGQLAEPVFKIGEDMVAQGMEHPTQLELSLAIALLYFKEQRTDIVLVEVGKGGAFDATNAIGVPEVTVLTNMDFQNQDEPIKPLQDFVDDRAGILKKGTSLVLYKQDEKIMELTIEKCRELHIPYEISSAKAVKLVNQTAKGQKLILEGRATQLSLVGEHQRCNVALALSAIKFLKEKGFGFSAEGILAGFSRTVWPGRFEQVHISPDFILDGCHNVQSVRAVVKTLQDIYPEKSVIFLVGVLEHRNYQGMLDEVFPIAKKFVTVTPNRSNGLPAETLATYIQGKSDCPVVAAANVSSGVQMVLELADPDDVVCAWGSLHIVGDIRHVLGLC